MAEKIILIILMVIVFLFGVVCACVFAICDTKEEQQSQKKRQEEKEALRRKILVPIRQLTQEEIDEIHSKGKLTPDEKVEEWEKFGLCAPGDAIGSAGFRCELFNNCHECLVYYANEKLGHVSVIDELKITNSVLNG